MNNKERHAAIYTDLNIFGVPFKVMKGVIKNYPPSNYEFADKPEELPQDRDKPWLYLYGPPGSGKSTYGGYLLSLFTLTKYSRLPSRTDPKAPFYIRVGRLMQMMKDGFDSKKRDGAEAYERCLTSQFLVLDDLTSAPSSWELSQLDILIDMRYGDLGWTVITSNHSIPELSKELGSERITSRISEISTVMNMKEQRR